MNSLDIIPLIATIEMAEFERRGGRSLFRLGDLAAMAAAHREAHRALSPLLAAIKRKRAADLRRIANSDLLLRLTRPIIMRYKPWVSAIVATGAADHLAARICIELDHGELLFYYPLGWPSRLRNPCIAAIDSLTIWVSEISGTAPMPTIRPTVVSATNSNIRVSFRYLETMPSTLTFGKLAHEGYTYVAENKRRAPPIVRLEGSDLDDLPSRKGTQAALSMIADVLRADMRMGAINDYPGDGAWYLMLPCQVIGGVAFRFTIFSLAN